MLKPEFTGQFKRDYKLAIKRGFNPKKLEEVIILLHCRNHIGTTPLQIPEITRMYANAI